MKVNHEFSQNHAVVIGASMAGLLTAPYIYEIIRNNKAFLKVMNLIKPPASLFHPEILRRKLFPAKTKSYSPVLEKA